MLRKQQHPKPRRRRTFLREWRDYVGLTQEQAADRIGITQSQLSRIERGDSPYNQDFLEKASEAYNCDPADLLMRDPSRADAMWSITDQLKVATPEQREDVRRVVDALIRKAG
jgi:transcriptional regulator with XRE-family HTH domain